MGKIFNIFSTTENAPKGFSVERANDLVPLLKRYTEEAIQETQKIALKLEYLSKDTPQFKVLSKTHDQLIIRWAERVHRLGGLAKGLWTVDFDNGRGYLCWSFPEDRVEHYHSYEGGFKSRKKLSETAIAARPLTGDVATSKHIPKAPAKPGTGSDLSNLPPQPRN